MRSIWLSLKLGLRSVSLLTEEFPLASKYIQKLNNNEWMLDTEVCSFDGVGRFVMGLLDDIEIIDSPEFDKYILDLVNKFQNKLSLS